MTELSATALHELAKLCFPETDAADDDILITVEGLVYNYKFDRAAIIKHTAKIVELLVELPETFQQGKGDGWSFLKACNDKHNKQWTGLRNDMELLFCLGIAAGKASYVLPRETWSALPGGVPYVVLHLE